MHLVDFGCGAGGFALQRDDCNDYVVGIDSSPGMLAMARENSRHVLFFLRGDETALRLFKHRDAVVANLVTNYSVNLDGFVTGVSLALAPGGLCVVAELNPAYVRECLKRGIIYSDPEPAENPRHATLHFPGGAKRITLWERAEGDFHTLAAPFALLTSAAGKRPQIADKMGPRGIAVRDGA